MCQSFVKEYRGKQEYQKKSLDHFSGIEAKDFQEIIKKKLGIMFQIQKVITEREGVADRFSIKNEEKGVCLAGQRNSSKRICMKKLRMSGSCVP